VAKRFPDGPDDIDAEAVAQLALIVQGLAWRDLDMPPAYRDTLVVDSLARVVYELEPPVRSGDLDADHWSLLDDATVLRMVDSEHPEVEEVLDAIATGHPVGHVRKAAKKAIHKRRSSEA